MPDTTPNTDTAPVGAYQSIVQRLRAQREERSVRAALHVLKAHNALREMPEDAALVAIREALRAAKLTG